MKYDYREVVTDYIVDYIKRDFGLEDYAGKREDLKDDIKKNVSEEVSCSICDCPTARRHLEGNEKLIKEACYGLGIENNLPQIDGRLVYDEDIVKYLDKPDMIDAAVREWIATDCVEDALKKVEEEMDIDLDDDRTFACSEVIILKDELPDEVLSDIQDIYEEAELDGNRLVLLNVTPQELGEITSNLEYENIDFELERDALQSTEKMYVVYESIGNGSQEVFRSDNFNEMQDYLTGREEEARQDAEQKGEDFNSELFYSYFSPEETTAGELAKKDKEWAETNQAIRKMSNEDREL